MAGSESVAKTTVSSAKVAVVVSGEVGRSAVYRRYRRGVFHFIRLVIYRADTAQKQQESAYLLVT
jgi:hypothetical protein